MANSVINWVWNANPLKMYGNGYENMGLGEYPVAASSAATYFRKIGSMSTAASGYACCRNSWY